MSIVAGQFQEAAGEWQMSRAVRLRSRLAGAGLL
jgi:hypothetical protein